MLSSTGLLTNASGVLERKALQPRTESSLNVQRSLGGKRKLCHAEEDCELGGPISIKYHTSSSRNPLILNPRLLIPRSCLPLACLDASRSTSAPEGSSLFSAHITALETRESSMQCQEERKVLITEDKDNGTLFAVEKVRRGLYALCGLVDWVSLDDFLRKRIKSPRLQRLAIQDNSGDLWWKEAAIDITKRDESSDSLKHLSWSLSLKMPPGQVSAETATPVCLDLVPSENMLQPQTSPAFPSAENGTSAVSPESALDTIRVQYMEALYVSKTSLAYFAKGPLSRARAACQSQECTVPESCVLVEFLRSNILSVAINHKKYTATMPHFIQEIPVGVTEDDEGGPIMSAIYKKGEKSKKRKRISKGGFLPGEEDYLIRWWLNREGSLVVTGPAGSREGRMKSAIQEQRGRETQLQIILVLEVLALEVAFASQKQTSSTVAHTLKGEDEADTPKLKRSKKPQDLNILLDILVDRLCIWESTNQEGPMSRVEDSSNLMSETPEDPTEGSTKDRLRDFCVEVIIPFYATRLPNIYMSVCRKLGVALQSPPRPQLQKSASLSRISTKPGAALQRPQAKRPRKTLERVLTDDRLAAKRPPATLSRSATDSALPNFKRELSEVSLSAVPAYSPSIEMSRRYSQREVDLTAVSQATEAKIQRKAAIEKELKGAIATLKRPNPRMAVKELVDSADRRIAGARSKSRKASSPIRNPFANSVQVMATPKANRKGVVRSDLPAPPSTQILQPDIVPPSSDPRIPSSSIRPTTTSLFHSRRPNLSRTPSKPMLHRPGPFPSVAATPSRRNSSLAQTSSNANALSHDIFAFSHEGREPASPELPQPIARQISFKRPGLPSQAPFTPSKMRRRQSLKETVIDNTPVKVVIGPAVAADESLEPGITGELLEGSPAGCAKQQDDPQKSIYEALGWDDDVDDLL